MFVFYISMSILLNLNYARIFKDEQQFLLEYNSDAFHNNSIRLNSTLESEIFYSTDKGSSLKMKKFSVFNQKNRQIFQIYGIDY